MNNKQKEKRYEIGQLILSLGLIFLLFFIDNISISEQMIIVILSLIFFNLECKPKK
jgi:hypothetical protein